MMVMMIVVMMIGHTSGLMLNLLRIVCESVSRVGWTNELLQLVLGPVTSAFRLRHTQVIDYHHHILSLSSWYYHHRHHIISESVHRPGQCAGHRPDYGQWPQSHLGEPDCWKGLEHCHRNHNHISLQLLSSNHTTIIAIIIIVIYRCLAILEPRLLGET